MTLDGLRKDIDTIDSKIIELLAQRFEIVKDIGEYKKQHNLPILDENREKQVLDKRKEQLANEALWPHVEALFKHIMQISKDLEK